MEQEAADDLSLGNILYHSQANSRENVSHEGRADDQAAFAGDEALSANLFLAATSEAAKINNYIKSEANSAGFVNQVSGHGGTGALALDDTPGQRRGEDRGADGNGDKHDYASFGGLSFGEYRDLAGSIRSSSRGSAAGSEKGGLSQLQCAVQNVKLAASVDGSSSESCESLMMKSAMSAHDGIHKRFNRLGKTNR